ncbi:hypothetical protein TSAR_006152 [Trichomalopsis sarcophagae]|uniref:tRNA (guanine(26)-N(2))-dimethyltransferase n=1 Tax=Trichomalopsis sarcophagae TaxID=543379 RepID=A0A232EPC0_9HYME|nr:hypothetical protein TSAR_006152 [Trichomalopsis sarcophagae]
MEQSSTEIVADVLEEGQAKILLEKKNVFYNPVQEFNRDLSIAVLSQYSKERSSQSSIDSAKEKQKDDSQKTGLRVLEALSATGLRSIRYAKEVPGMAEIVANDISIKAVEAIKRNVIHNGVENIVTPHNDDATMVMYQNRKTKFDAVDLDPYGCPTIFLDGAVQCIKDNGLLLVTATDMAVLAGNSPETCYVKYGAVSLKSKSCHEMALRILLQHIASHAGRYGKVITPLLSISADFYIRVFLKIHTSQAACKKNTSNLGLVYQCVGCESLTLQPLGTNPSNNVYKLPHAPAVDKLCSICNHRHHMGGPIWLGPLHDKNFVQKILTEIDSPEDNNLKALKTLRRIQGILHVVHEELENPLYYQLDRLTSIIKCNVPQMVSFRSALLNAGYKVSYSHANKTSVKTDAPNQVIWDIVRAWEKDNPVKREKFESHSSGLAILNGESKTEVSFKKHPDAVPYSQQKKLTRYQLNPSTYWGPGTRSTTMIQSERGAGKKERNQNKNKRKREQNSSESTTVEEKKQNVADQQQND